MNLRQFPQRNRDATQKIFASLRQALLNLKFLPRPSVIIGMAPANFDRSTVPACDSAEKFCICNKKRGQ